MKTEKDINNNLMVNDFVLHPKTGIRGRIDSFEWSGKRRALIKNNDKALHIIDVAELELISREDKSND